MHRAAPRIMAEAGMDRRLRNLERRAAQGDTEARASYDRLRLQLRADEVRENTARCLRRDVATIKAMPPGYPQGDLDARRTYWQPVIRPATKLIGELKAGRPRKRTFGKVFDYYLAFRESQPFEGSMETFGYLVELGRLIGWRSKKRPRSGGKGDEISRALDQEFNRFMDHPWGFMTHP